MSNSITSLLTLLCAEILDTSLFYNWVLTLFEDLAIFVHFVDLDSVLNEFLSVHFFIINSLNLLKITMEFKKGMIDKQLQGQLLTVFQ